MTAEWLSSGMYVGGGEDGVGVGAAGVGDEGDRVGFDFEAEVAGFGVDGVLPERVEGVCSERFAQEFEGRLVGMLGGDRSLLLSVTGVEPPGVGADRVLLSRLRGDYLRACEVNPALRWYGRLAKCGLSLDEGGRSLSVDMDSVPWGYCSRMVNDISSGYGAYSPIVGLIRSFDEGVRARREDESRERVFGDSMVRRGGGADELFDVDANWGDDRVCVGDVGSGFGVDRIDVGSEGVEEILGLLGDGGGEGVEDGGAGGVEYPDGGYDGLRLEDEEYIDSVKLGVSMEDLSLASIVDFMYRTNRGDAAVVSDLKAEGFSKKRIDEVMGALRVRRHVDSMRDFGYEV